MKKGKKEEEGRGGEGRERGGKQEEREGSKGRGRITKEGIKKK